MWILPSQLSKCAPGMEALDLESKTYLASDCEPSHIVSLRGLLKPISSVRWKKDSWMQHLFGAILKPSHTNLFTDLWTSSLRDTLVSHSLPLESEQEKKTQDIFGLGLQTEFDFFSQQCASLKMSKDISRWDSPQSSVIWKNWVTKCRGEYSVRRNASMQVDAQHRTNASGSSSWPTIRVKQAEDCASERRRKNTSLDSIVKQELEHGPAGPVNSNTHGSHQGLSDQSQQNWQTFAHGTHNRGETPHRQVVRALVHGDKAKTQCLTVDQVFAEEIKGTNQRQESWATPQASDHVEGRRTDLDSNQKCLGRDMKTWATATVSTGAHRQKDGSMTPKLDGQVNGKLNPRWVETLMGLNLGWTCPSCPASVILNWPRFVTGWLKLNHAQMNSDYLETELCQQQQPELF